MHSSVLTSMMPGMCLPLADDCTSSALALMLRHTLLSIPGLSCHAMPCFLGLLPLVSIHCIAGEIMSGKLHAMVPHLP